MTFSALIAPDVLAAHLGDADLVVLDIRSSVDGGGREAYLQGHVSGAIHTDYVKDGWRASKGNVPGLLPDESFLAALFGRLGITPDRSVVIVSAGNGAGDFSAAARVYWTLKVCGHDRLAILNGGMQAWRSDPNNPIEQGEGRAIAPAADYPIRLRPQLRAHVADVGNAIGDPASVLLDSRSASYFEGREKSPQALRAGRIPSALHIDHAEAFDPATKQLRPVAELQKLFAPAQGRPVVNYCNTGHQAATSWFILSEILRQPDAALYDGSMSEWTQDETRPVATGADDRDA